MLQTGKLRLIPFKIPNVLESQIPRWKKGNVVRKVQKGIRFQHSSTSFHTFSLHAMDKTSEQIYIRREARNKTKLFVFNYGKNVLKAELLFIKYTSLFQFLNSRSFIGGSNFMSLKSWWGHVPCVKHYVPLFHNSLQIRREIFYNLLTI